MKIPCDECLINSICIECCEEFAQFSFEYIKSIDARGNNKLLRRLVTAIHIIDKMETNKGEI
ncbi:MAG: hypothetical protein ACFFG0_00135 [Candidatus Thorarchaeota archaeon]